MYEVPARLEAMRFINKATHPSREGNETDSDSRIDNVLFLKDRNVMHRSETTSSTALSVKALWSIRPGKKRLLAYESAYSFQRNYVSSSIHDLSLHLIRSCSFFVGVVINMDSLLKEDRPDDLHIIFQYSPGS